MSDINTYLQSGFTFVPAVVGYVVKGDEVLLGLRKKVSLGLGEKLIAGIGGKVGDKAEFAGETHEEALLREVFEETGDGETGLRVLNYIHMGRVRWIFPTKPEWSQDAKVYIVDKWKGELAETDAIKAMWFPKSNLPKDRMWPDNAYWVPKVLAGEKVDAVFLFDEEGNIKEYKYLCK